MRFHRRGKNRFGDDPDPAPGREHPPTNGTNGVHPPGMTIRSIPLGTGSARAEDDEPVDLVAVQADDELINALAGGMSVSAGGRGADESEEHVSAILAAWKAEVDARPIPELLTVDEGVAAVRAARRPAHRLRHLAPLAAAAAFLVITIGGVSVSSYSAEPDDVLWPVAKVLYSERTTSIEAADRVEEHITRAKEAIAAGEPAVAEQELRAASADLAVVRPEEGRTELAEVQDFLIAKAGETTPGVPTDPGAPLVADQARKVPPGAVIAVPGRTSAQSSTAELPSGVGSSSSDPTSAQAPSPAAPQVDPRQARVAPPVQEPEQSSLPPEDATSAPESNTGPDTSGEPSGSEEGSSSPAPQEPVPGDADGAQPQPDAAPEDSGSLGATPSDTSALDSPTTS